MGGKRKNYWFRPVIQVFFFALVALIVGNHFLVGKGNGIAFLSSASLHAICPFGGVVSIYQYLSVGTYVKKVHEASFILMYIMLFLTIFFGPIFCGWVCPLGSFQEWIGKIGKRLFSKKYNNFVPKAADKYLRYFRYIVLAWVIYATAITGRLAFEEVDPYFALFQFWTGEVAITAFAILAITMIGAIFVERPWCKYACPYGAVLSITGVIKIFRIKRNNQTCINCGLCNEACPMNIEVSKAGSVNHSQCITCMECTSERVCPVQDTVSLRFFGDNGKGFNLPVQGGKKA